jgi:SAM-dependent methyltransferase
MATWGPDVSTGQKTLRGVVRHALLYRSLAEHVPDPVRVLDITGRSVHVWSLARRGCHVTVVDPDPETFERVRSCLAADDPDVSERIHLVESDDEALRFPADQWRLVCCHGMPRQADRTTEELTRAVEATAPGGFISVVTENPAAASLRPAMEGRWSDAVALLDSTAGADDNFGFPSVTDLMIELGSLGAPVENWYGIGVATDHLRYTRADRPGHELAFDLEWELSRRDPYRACGHLLHLVSRRDAPVSDEST